MLLQQENLFIKNKMKKCFFISIALFFILSTKLYSQNLEDILRFEDYNLECKTSNKEILEQYKKGYKLLNNSKYVNTAGKVFFNIIKEDKSLCDAYFFTGVSLTRQGMYKDAFVYYYYADSLAVNPNVFFKEKLAEASLRINNIDLSRKIYKDIVLNFPESPIGYFGIALTGTTIGDFENALENLEIAEKKYSKQGHPKKSTKNEIWVIKGILLTKHEKYADAIECFNKCEAMFGHLDDYNAHFAIASYHLYEQTQNKEWKDKSLKAFKRIKDQRILEDEFIKKYVHYFNDK